MRRRFAQLLVLSAIILGGCAQSTVVVDNDLPSLAARNHLLIVQVPASSSVQHRDHAYFIVCDNGGCPELGSKTMIQTTPIVTITQQQPAVITKAHTINGENATYLSKSEELLLEFRIHFDYASADVTPVSKAVLAKFVNHYPHNKRRVRITGFTDNDAKPSGQIGNEWLALERARNTRQAMIELGYPASQILLEGKFLCCYIASNKTAADRRLNRRAELIIISTE